MLRSNVSLPLGTVLVGYVRDDDVLVSALRIGTSNPRGLRALRFIIYDQIIRREAIMALDHSSISSLIQCSLQTSTHFFTPCACWFSRYKSNSFARSTIAVVPQPESESPNIMLLMKGFWLCKLTFMCISTE